TLRATGYQREVRAVVVEADRRTRVAGRLEPSPRYARVDALLRELAPALGAATLESAAGELWSLFGVDQAVFLTVDGERYDAYVYDLHDGRRLAHATATVGAGGDLARTFRRLAGALYTAPVLDMPAPGP